jgi:hypothetical protein
MPWLDKQTNLAKHNKKRINGKRRFTIAQQPQRLLIGKSTIFVSAGEEPSRQKRTNPSNGLALIRFDNNSKSGSVKNGVIQVDHETLLMAPLVHLRIPLPIPPLPQWFDVASSIALRCAHAMHHAMPADGRHPRSSLSGRHHVDPLLDVLLRLFDQVDWTSVLPAKTRCVGGWSMRQNARR